MCILALIWLIEVFITMYRHKSKGIPLNATIIDYRIAQNNYFPIFEFEYNGETLTVDSYYSSKTNTEKGTTDTIYYIPGNKKGVFRERDLKPKPWMIIGGILALFYVIFDFAVLSK